MDIMVGKNLDLRLFEPQNRPKPKDVNNEVNAKILGMRSSRQLPMYFRDGYMEKRADRVMKDPADSKVITLIVENGDKIPHDIEKGDYLISIKFTKK